MKRSAPNFLTYLISIFTLGIFLSLCIYLIKQNHNQISLINALSTNHIILTNQVILTNQIILPAQIISTNGVSSSHSHLISVLVGSTCTMQIRADNFLFKDGILSCQALNHDFYIVGTMHSIVIEEIKPGIQPITLLLNKPSERKETNEKQQ